MDTTETKLLASVAAASYRYTGGTITNNTSRFSYRCQAGHQHEMSAANFLKGRRCPSCANLSRNHYRKLGLKTVSGVFASEQYRLLATSYMSNRTPLACSCPLGHLWSVTWNNWRMGKRCPHPDCKTRPHGLIISQAEALQPITDSNYSILDGADEYQNVKSYLTLQCPQEHTPYRVMVYNFRNGRRCPGCACRTSKGEQELFLYFQTLAPDAVSGARVLDGLEVDCYSPALKLGVEYHGLYWHSEAAGKGRDYHLKKLESAERQGIRLLQFFEDEWQTSRPLVEAMVAQAAQVGLQRVAARSCDVRELDLAARTEFFDRCHLQGATAASRAWGLYHAGVLVQAMSVRKVKFTGGPARYDIARLASVPGAVVVGGVSRLAKRALEWVREQGGTQLYTYADRRYSVGNAYVKAGFKPLGASGPGYWYTDNHERRHRFGLRKTQECPRGLTEVEWRRQQGWSRIWDCGQLRYVLE